VGLPDANGRATEVYAPRDIAPDDEAGAWEWFRAITGPVVAFNGATVAELAELYLADLEARVHNGTVVRAHYRAVVSHLSRFVAWTGRLRAGDVSPRLVERWLASLAAEGLSSHYATSCLRSVRAAYSWATGTVLGVNPLAGWRARGPGAVQPRFAERRVAACWLWWCSRRPGPFAGSFALLQWSLVRTGARPGELCALLWSDLEWRAGRTPQGAAFARGVLRGTRSKQGRLNGATRSIYFPPSITRALRRQFDARESDHVFLHGLGRGGPRLPWESGSRLSATTRRVRRELAAYLAEHGGRFADLDLRDSGPGRITGYLWRHTAISTLVMLGVDLLTVATLAGTSPDMVSKHYGHLLDGHLGRAAATLAYGRFKP
jgi:integrase